MILKTSHIEILAPAGSFESLQAAINAGCNAIYFGIGDMNMRATAAANFSNEDMPEIVKICHENNVKAYLTLNTLVYDQEVADMKTIVETAKKVGIDAVIAADMATIAYANQVGLEVHISTQLSISNIESVKFYSKFSDRLVLARELTIDQVKEICVEIKKQDIRGPKGNLIEIEVFAHGALCVAVSGRCSMSLYCYNTSANKGRCTQICRRRYKVTDIDTGKELVVDNNYIMSSSDLCTIGMLDKLVDAGVSVLKFEGRGRSADYVDTVIKTYKNALKSLEDGTYTSENIIQWNRDLKTVFNRGTTEGFYMGRKMDEWSGVHGSKATKEKYAIGTVEKYYPKINVVQIAIQAKDEVNIEEEFLIIGPKTGVVKGKIPEFMVNDKPSKVMAQGDVVTFKIDSAVKEGDKFYVVRDRLSDIPKGREVLIK